MTTKIEWTEESWNPITGCTPASPGCQNCYAKSIAKRFWGKRKFTDIQFHTDRLDQPLRWRSPRMVFVNSMSDLFHEDVLDISIAAIFGVMAAAPKHTFQLLTKRPQRMRDWFAKMNNLGGLGRYIRSDGGRNELRSLFDGVRQTEVVDGRTYRSATDPWMEVMNAAACNYGQTPLANLWLGVTCENQEWLIMRARYLMQIRAAVRFISFEPLLGEVDIPAAMRSYGTYGQLFDSETMDYNRHRILPCDWAIVGCETGPGRRPCKLEWIRTIVDQCHVAAVPVFVKAIPGGRKPIHAAEAIAGVLRCKVEEIRQFPRRVP